MSNADTLERADLTVSFDGEALRQHSMSVRDLAPALLGLADVFQHSNELLNPGEPQVSLDIRATNDGSFMVQLAVIHEQIVRLLDSRDALALTSLITYILGTNGLFRFLAAKGGAQANQQSLPNGAVRLTEPDGTSLEYPPEVVSLAKNPAVRKGAQAVVAPLAQDGISEVLLQVTGGSTSVRITTEDLPNIADATSDEHQGALVTDQHYQQLLIITSPNFQPGNKWRLTDGQATYWVGMDDPVFLGQIDRGEIAFRKSDRLRADVWLRQWQAETGEVHTERSVTQVLEFLPRPATRQDPLPLPNMGKDPRVVAKDS